jgi:hypothetical protein
MAAAAVVGLAAFGMGVLAARAASDEPAIPAGAHFTSWADNGNDGERVLQLVKGDLPKVAEVVTGVVKTDTNCDPDASGINHCHNVIALGNGGEIEVVHNHEMMHYPCLSPGDKLTLAKLADGWLVAKDGQ